MQVTITKDSANQRCDRFLRKYCKAYPEVKLSDIYSWIRKGQVLVNGKKTKEDYRVEEGDEVSFEDIVLGKKDARALISSKEKKIQKLTIDVVKPWIIYENKNWLVFNKPSAVVIHPSNKHWNDLCMNDYLEWYLTHTGEYTPEQKASGFVPSFGYRLDKDTSGVLIAAKTAEALQYLNQVIRDRQIEKYYLTIVPGTFPPYIKIDKPLEKGYSKQFDRAHVKVTSHEDGQEAVTECRKEKTIYHKLLGQLSLVKVKIHTGRMHQIRVHLTDAGFPILGDIVYGNPVVNRKLYKQLNINRQLLHCRRYSFADISNKRLTFEAPLPDDFETIMKNK